ncbi:type VI secretion system-associated FHA domain protein TagH [Alsobacter metallidurans]|nr:type VI secretion system-associated FHA domain protein TagH [Alsobacter metallidurans]
MTELVLTTLRCPDSVPTEQRRVTSSEFKLGRGDGCDWRLTDGLRALSKEHCVLEFHHGGWQVRDLSSNGTFVNDARHPVGRGNVYPLQSGDRLRLGPYEIELQTPAAPVHRSPPSSGVSEFSFAPEPVDLASAPNPFDEHSFFRPDEAAPPAALQSDPTQEEFQAFTPPAVLSPNAAFPDDLDLSLDEPAAKPVPMLPPAQLRAASPLDLDFAPAPDSPVPLSAPVPQPAPAGVTPPAARAFAASPGGDLGDLLAGAELSGELSERAIADPAEALRTAGALLRSLTAGVRDLLIARNSVKQEFRIQQTVMHASRNNPVKFAATDEQALAALLDPKTPALAAVQETLDDLIRHQVATLEATQAAARSLLERMAPAVIEAETPAGGLLPGSREKRLWDNYKKHHATLVDDFNDDFDSAFGKAFARAYEETTDKRGR